MSSHELSFSPKNNKANLYFSPIMATFSKYFLILFTLMVSGSSVFARDGMKLYSIGHNTAWTSPASWSLSANGQPSVFIPQYNDTLIINSQLVLNTDFNLSGNGYIEISSSGNLKGNAFNLSISGEAGITCLGDCQLYTLNLSGNAAFTVGYSGRLKIVNTLTVLSPRQSIVNGELTVYGNLECGGAGSTFAGIHGSGVLKGNTFTGTGSIMSISSIVLIPQGSALSGNNWLGSIDTDWNEPMNWSGNIVPETSSNIAILAVLNQPVIHDQAYCGNLYLSPGTSLKILAGATLNAGQNLFIPVDAELLLKNSVTSRASLIAKGSVSGKIKSEINVMENSPMFVSSPVQDAQSGVFINMYLREYNEAGSGWGEYIVPTDQELNPMKGYELFSIYGATRIFEGTPIQGEVYQAITSSNEGWNLIGNPFPCYLDWQSDESSSQGWQRNTIGNAIYYPDPSGSGNYSVYLNGDDPASVNNGSRYIAPMQGFFVKARQNGIIKVNNNAVATVTENAIPELEHSAIRFRVEGSGTHDEAIVRFNPSSSFSFDDDYDAYKIPGTGNATTLFTTLADETRLSINTMPSPSSTLEIPLGVTCSSTQQLKLTVAGNTLFEYRYPLMLEDKATNRFLDLRDDSTYVFQHSPSMDPMRFVLHFETIAGLNENKIKAPRILISDGIIEVSGTCENECTVDVFGLDGKPVLQQSGVCAPEFRIPFHGYHGVYIVRVTTKTTSHALKLFADK